MNIRTKIYGGVSAEEPILKSKRPKSAKRNCLESVTVPREVQRSSDSRGEDRHRLTQEQAQITHDGTDLNVELVNLSGGGAMIKAGFRPKLWDRIDLHLGNHGTIECAVRWIRNGQIGLEFAHETRLDWPSDQVAIVLRHVIERTFPHIIFPQSQPESLCPPSEEHSDENRAASRHPLIWNGTLHHDFQSNSVRIRNISSSGAMIETSAKVRVGTEPLLELAPAISLSATVEWAIGDQVGVKFHSPFDMNLLAESRPSVAPSHWSPPAYLESERGSQVPWNRLTIAELRQELEGFLKR